MKTVISSYFLKGYARALDLSGKKEWPDIDNDKQKDFEALRKDWENVGEFIRKEKPKYNFEIGLP